MQGPRAGGYTGPVDSGRAPGHLGRLMADPRTTLEPRFEAALRAAFGDELAKTDPVLRRSDRADFQADVAMALAKKLGKPPRDVAQAIVDHLDVTDICDKVEIAGPGFINLTLSTECLAREVGDGRARPERRRRPGERARDGRRRLLGAERRQGDARRAPAQHRHRRRARARARGARPPRDPPEPRRRLGHAVRHAHRAPARPRRGGRARDLDRRSRCILPSRRAPSSTSDPAFAERAAAARRAAPGRRRSRRSRSGGASSTRRRATSARSTRGSASR